MKNNANNTAVQVNNENQKKLDMQKQLAENINNMENHNNCYFCGSPYCLRVLSVDSECSASSDPRYLLVLLRYLYYFSYLLNFKNLTLL